MNFLRWLWCKVAHPHDWIDRWVFPCEHCEKYDVRKSV